MGLAPRAKVLKRVWNLILILIAGIVLCLGIYGIVSSHTAWGSIRDWLAEPPTDVQVSYHVSEYSFDPATVRQAIASGRSDVFHLERELGLPARGSFKTVVPQVFEQGGTYVQPTITPGHAPLVWSEADFRLVLDANIRFMGLSSLDDSQLFEITFFVPCQDAGVGLLSISYHFIKVQQVGQSNHYFQRSVFIDLEAHRLLWLDSELSKIANEPRGLERLASDIPAERVLQAAERVGGADFHAKYAEQCRASGILRRGIYDDQWDVMYMTDIPASQTLDVRVDKKTGEASLITTSP